MDKVVLITVIIAFLALLSLFTLMFFGKTKQKTTKTGEGDKSEEKKLNETSKVTKKIEPIPEILKEVTMGNYLHELSGGVANEVQIEENLDIEGPSKKEDIFKDIDDAFKDIAELGDDLGDEINEDIDKIDEFMIDDSYISDAVAEVEDLDREDDVRNNERGIRDKTIRSEYIGLSKEMKAIIIANILNKKHE